MRFQHLLRITGIMTLGLALSGGLFAQQAGNESMQDKVAAVKQAAAQNQAALRHYQWVETTQIAMKGEVKSTKQSSCLYGADGKVIKTPMEAAAPPQQDSGGGRHGRLKEAVVANKTEELTDYMQKAKALVGQYVPPDPDLIQKAMAAGNISVTPMPTPGLVSLVIKNYYLPGDALTLSFLSAEKKITDINVNSYLDDPKDVVTLAVQFAALPDGTSYEGQIVLNATAKQMVVTITNGNYQKLGQ